MSTHENFCKGSSASISKERRIVTYRHNETWWSEESAVFFHRHLRLIVRLIGTQGHQGVGKMYGVGEEGETTEGKKWRAGLKRMNISMDHLALYTQWFTGLSVESWRLKPASTHSPRNRGFCCPRICFERVEDGEPALSNFAQVLHLLLREGGENLK